MKSCDKTGEVRILSDFERAAHILGAIDQRSGAIGTR
jgi:hypothetical protein